MKDRGQEGSPLSAAPSPQPFIAVVDDDRSVRTALCRLLRAAGFAADAYESAAEFLRAMPTQAPDCLVLDVQMPEISGLELQQRLNSMRISLPVVMITGHDDAAMHAKCMAAGANVYLSKPLDDKELLRAIQKAMEQPSRHRH